MGTGIDGGIDGGGSDSGSSSPSFPVLAVSTTAELIRDRAIDVIAALVPRQQLGTRFVRHRNERDGDFVAWATANPASAFRRFQVRTTIDAPPEVSNTDFEERQVTLAITIAYPTNARTGADHALDRDDVIDEDFKQLDFAVGIYGRANFSPPFPDAMPLGATKSVVRSESVDFLVFEEVFNYQRSTS